MRTAISRCRTAFSAVLVLGGCAVTKNNDPDSDPSGTTDAGTSDPTTDAGTTDAGDPEPEVVDPPEGDYLDDTVDEEVPELDAAALTTAGNLALAEAVSVNGGPAVAAYFEALGDSDAACPVWNVSDGTPFWFDSCTTDSGAYFDGYGYHYEYVGESDGSNTWTGFAINTLATITTADGHVFEGAGAAGYLTGVDAGGNDVWYSYVQPGFSYDGAAAEGTWLDDGLDPNMTWYALRVPASGGVAATLNGSAKVSDGPLAALVFNDILLLDELLGSSCPEEPHGSLSVLDNDGHWIDVYFDGPEWEGPETPPELCDGCGAAWYRGTFLGEACFDFSPLADSDNFPFVDQE